MLSRLKKRRWHIIILALLTLAMVLPGLASLPVIDRDEARFAQASVQMADTNDLLNINFQDEARNKKPAAAYWAQTAMIEVFSRDGENRIWAQRLPSVLASLLSILALYWGGLRMVGRKAALMACALLATSLIFVFESHIAKTDAMLCASTTVMFASLGRLRNSAGRREVWAFWVALGLSIMIKGPIGPVLAIMSLVCLWIWERDLSWARPLLNWGAIVLFVLIWLPWGIAMYVITDGAFYIESLGKDFGGKVISGQESHGAPPGSHGFAIWATLWPASLFLLPGLAYAIQSVRSGAENPVIRSMKLAICWALPFWILIEIMPTKLPHYGLPVFPALCLMMGAAILAMSQTTEFAKTRFFGGLIFILSTTLVLGALLYAQSVYGDLEKALVGYAICGASGVVAILAGFALWGNKIRVSFGAALISGMIAMVGAYAYILPNLTEFRTSEYLTAELERFAPNVESSLIHSPHYTEPSLVYHVGTDIHLKAREVDLSDGSLVILNTRRQETENLGRVLSDAAEKRGLCLATSKPVKGFNYSKGNPLDLVILKEVPCEALSQAEPS
ncbi:MAG: glycosyltransferase family 39 protein [Litorimonas sp.]